MMKCVRDIASSLETMMILLDGRSSLYKAMTKSGLVTPEELAAYTKNAEH
jgi:hypothetical protein